MARSHPRRGVAIFCILFVATATHCFAVQEKDLTKKHKKPPLLVTVEYLVEGSIQPRTEFVGTTAYSRISNVATDVEGLVKEVSFTVGDYVEKGDQLVLLDSALLDQDLIATRAEYEQNRIDLEESVKDFKRIDTLYAKQSISETQYDSALSRQKRLEKRSIVLESKLKKLLLKKEKKKIQAPFSGVIIKKSTEVGEWLAKGGKIASVADNTQIDVLAEVTVGILANLENEKQVQVAIGTTKQTAGFYTFIPKGDIATRTFTAKFRLDKPEKIVEGLEALLTLPSGPRAVGFLVSRDAVVNKYGEIMVFLAMDKTARRVPVKVVGYHGLKALVTGDGLEKGLKVIVKGSKRVKDGQQIRFKRVVEN